MRAYRAKHPERHREQNYKQKRKRLAATSAEIPALEEMSRHLDTLGDKDRCREFADCLSHDHTWISDVLEDFVVRWVEELE